MVEYISVHCWLENWLFLYWVYFIFLSVDFLIELMVSVIYLFLSLLLSGTSNSLIRASHAENIASRDRANVYSQIHVVQDIGKDTPTESSSSQRLLLAPPTLVW